MMSARFVTRDIDLLYLSIIEYPHEYFHHQQPDHYYL